MNYSIGVGIVQCYVTGPDFFQHFGCAEYDRNLPILSDSLRKQVEPIVSALNSGAITHATAKNLLSKIRY